MALLIRVDFNCSNNSGIPEILKVSIRAGKFTASRGKATIAHRYSDLLRDGQQRAWRMASSGMLGRVALVRTDISEELSAFFIRVTRIGELGTTLAVTSNRRSASVASCS
jgi:hypothetical protein